MRERHPIICSSTHTDTRPRRCIPQQPFSLRQPTQIVHHHLGTRPKRQARRRARVQVTQHAIAYPAVRHPPNLILHPFEPFTKAGIRTLQSVTTDLQTQRVQTREPTHRARYIHPIAQCLAAMPFEVHQQPTTSTKAALLTPSLHREHQRTQQHLIHSPVIGLWNPREYRFRQVLSKRHVKMQSARHRIAFTIQHHSG